MATTTFSGAVRSENGFKVINKNSTTGAITETSSIASTGIVTNKYVKHVGYATGVTVNTTAGDSDNIGEFTQPANTIITDIKIFCATSQLLEQVTSDMRLAHQALEHRLFFAQTDEILDGGTTVVVGNVTVTSLVLQTQDATTASSLCSVHISRKNYFLQHHQYSRCNNSRFFHIHHRVRSNCVVDLGD